MLRDSKTSHGIHVCGSYREEHSERLVESVGAVGPRVPDGGAQLERARGVDGGSEAPRPARRERRVLRGVVSAHQPVLLEQLPRVSRETRTRAHQHTQLLHLRAQCRTAVLASKRG